MRYVKRAAEATMLLLGLVLFAFIIKKVGIAALPPLLAKLGGWGWTVFLIYPLMCLWDVLAWRCVLDAEWRNHVPFSSLYGIRLTGEALNNVTPVIDIGGEPLKILWLEKFFGVPHEAGLKSVVLSRTALFMSEIAFVAVGLLLFLRFFPVPIEWQTGLSIGICLFALAGVIFLITVKSFRRFKSERAAFIASCTLHFVGWSAGAIEMYFIFGLLGSPVSLFQAFILESLLQLVRITSFFIPANLGAQEGGLMFLAGTLGYSSPVGVAASLLKRTRQLIWTALGFILWGILKAYGRRRPT